MKVSSLIFFLVLWLTTGAQAQSGREAVLITVGPGDEVWEQFGHNMIEIRGDPRYGQDVCFNWGLFDFQQPNFIGRFIQGRMLYSMDGLASTPTLEEYRKQNRRVRYQKLPLTDAQIDELIVRCEINRRPGNAEYRYDYFLDNCSTRVRDMLDRVTQGQVRRILDAQKPLHPMSYRKHVVRLMQSDLPLSLGIDFALGPSCDRTLTAWEEAFLPQRLMTYMEPMSSATIAPWPSTRPSEPDEPPDRRLPLLLAGLLGGAAMVSLELARVRWARRVGTILASGWWLIAGVGGWFMLYLWCFTDHAAGYANQNLWHFSPLGWAVPALWIVAARRQKQETPRRAIVKNILIGVLALIFLSQFIGLIGHAVGLFSQQNAHFIALALPLNVAAGLTAWRSVRQHRPA